MLQCNGIVRSIGKPADGKAWVIRKNAGNIPFVTDSVTTMWCMSVFQESDKNQNSNKQAIEDLPDLSVSAEDIATSSSTEKTDQQNVGLPPMGMPGASPTAGNLIPLVLQFTS